MMSWQNDYIDARRSELIQITNLDADFLADLKNGSFSSYDVEAVTSSSLPTIQDKANKFYNIVQTKSSESYDELTILFIKYKMTGPLQIFLEGYEKMKEPIPVQWIFAKASVINEERFWKLAAKSIKVKVHHEDFKLVKILPMEEHTDAYKLIYDFIKKNENAHPICLFKPKTAPKQIQESAYISRKLSIRNKLKKKMFAADLPEGHTFVFRGLENLEQLDKISDNSNFADESKNQLHNVMVPLILLNKESHFETICERTKNAVHLIEWRESTDSFLLIKSSKAAEQIRQGNLENDDVAVTENTLYGNSETISCPRLIGIADSPGVGKSSLLGKLAANFENDKTIALLLDLKDFAKHLEKFSDLTAKPLEPLIEYVCTNDCSMQIFRTLIRENCKVRLLLDDYDAQTEEAHNQLDRFLINLVKSNCSNIELFIASRGYLRSKLEHVLGSVTYKLRPLNLEEHEKILTNFWIHTHGAGFSPFLESFGKKCLEVFETKLTDFKHEITGIPLHGERLAKVFSKDAVRTSRNNSETEVHVPLILKVYNNIVKFKFSRISKKLRKEYKVYHVNAAIKSCYRDWLARFPSHLSKRKKMTIDESKVYSVGLIEEGTFNDFPKFIHITFANFFVSKYLVENLSRCPNLSNFLIKVILADTQSSAISTFINIHLGKYSTRRDIPIEIMELNSNEISTALKFCCKHNLKYCFELLANCLKNVDKISPIWRAIRDECFKSLPHLVIENSTDFQFVQKVMNFTKQDFRADLSYYAKEPEEYLALYPWVTVVDFTPVHRAIQLGKYNIVLSFRKECEDQMRSMNLMHFCVEGSAADNDEVISGKCRIMALLKKINPNCLTEMVNGRLPHLCLNVHEKLIHKLKELGADIHADLG